jgi:hypothetical protein
MYSEKIFQFKKIVFREIISSINWLTTKPTKPSSKMKYVDNAFHHSNAIFNIYSFWSYYVVKIEEKKRTNKNDITTLQDNDILCANLTNLTNHVWINLSICFSKIIRFWFLKKPDMILDFYKNINYRIETWFVRISIIFSKKKT